MSGLLVLEFLYEDFLDSSGNSFLHVKTQKNTLNLISFGPQPLLKTTKALIMFAK